MFSAPLLEPDQQILAVDLIAWLHGDFGNNAINFSVNGSFHLHGFDREQHVARRDVVADLDLKTRDDAWHRRADLLGIAESGLGAGLDFADLAADEASGPGTANPPERSSPDEPGFAELTEREREVLDLMAAGHGNQTIAQRLHLAPKTVRNHVSNVIGKLQAPDRGDAVVRARRHGFGNEP